MKRFRTILVILIVPLVAGCASTGAPWWEGDVSWTTLVDLDFEDPNTDVRIIETDPGLKWSVSDGEGRLTGRPTDSRWLDNGVELLLAGDRRTVLEIAYDFRIARASDSGRRPRSSS